MLVSKRLLFLLSFSLGATFFVSLFPLFQTYLHDSVKPKFFTSMERLGCLDVLEPQLLEKGASEMASRQVVVAGIIRDNAKQLPMVIKYIEHTGTFFRDYRVIIVEGDSTDGTKQLLQEWRARNSKVNVLTKDYFNKKRPNIAFLAEVRNLYLDELQTNPAYESFDTVMVVDMDMAYGWDMRGLFHSFGQAAQWDVVCSNGIDTSYGRMYDMFAFRDARHPENSTHPEYWSKLVFVGQKVYPVNSPLMSVYSCFGGLAFYKRSFITTCRYTSFADDCEHVFFHKCLSSQHARIVMNPSQIIRYMHYFNVYPHHEIRLILIGIAVSVVAVICLIKIINSRQAARSF